MALYSDMAKSMKISSGDVNSGIWRNSGKHRKAAENHLNNAYEQQA